VNPANNFVVNPQFNVVMFGKMVNFTFNDIFMSELISVLVLNQEIADDFHGFVDDITSLKARDETTSSIQDTNNEYGLFRHTNNYVLMMEQTFARDLAYAVNDSVRLYSEGKNLHVNSLFAFSKRIENALDAERQEVDNRNYMGRNRNNSHRMPQNGYSEHGVVKPFKRGFHIQGRRYDVR